MEKPKILIADDDFISLRIFMRILEREGYELISAMNGEEALVAVTNHFPDLIILDIQMPKMNGYEVCHKIKENKETMIIPVVMVTSLSRREEKLEGIEAGADDFFTKPVDRLELIMRVRNLLKVKAYHENVKTYNERLEKEVAERTFELKEALAKLQELNETVKKNSLETIYRLSVSAEFRDGDTGKHIKRMSRATGAVARQLGYSPEFADTILYASPMHDIGKIGIPDKILLKPGKLSDDEWFKMRQHTTIGASILSDSGSELLQMAHMIALTHHEKFDGTGYPNGLKGTEIPIEGRITAITDVFDALISRRPYKEPFSIDRSVDIIKATTGSHFDPLISEAFFGCFDEILEISRGEQE